MTMVDALLDAPRARRGRPSLAQAGAIDRKVLDAGRALLIEAGFDGTTMEAVAARARVTKVTLYARYRDKAALLRAVLDDRLDTWSRLSSGREPTPDASGADLLRRHARTMLAWNRDPEVRAMDRLIAGCRGSAEPVARELETRLRAPMLAVLEHAFARHAAEIGCASADPRRLAAMFFGLIAGLIDKGGLDTDADRLVWAERAARIMIEGSAAW